MNSKKVSGIILKRVNFGESDKIITLFTKNEGKIKVIAKGARKMKSKFCGHIEMMNKSQFILHRGKTFKIATEVSLIENYLGHSTNLGNLKNLYFMTEVIEKTLPENHPAPELYDLYETCLSNYKIRGEDELIKLYFVSQYLRISGQFPHIRRCVKCNAELDNVNFFSNLACGALDLQCGDYFYDKRPVNKDFLKFWKFISEESIEKLFRIRIPTEILEEAAEIANDYFFAVSDLKLKSLKLNEA